MYLDREDIRVIVGATAGTALVTIALWMIVGSMALVLTVVAGLAIVITIQFDHFRRQKEHATDNLRQVQALFTLSSQLQTRMPLPPFTGWAANAELAAWVVAIIRETRPSTIMEIGSGASTILAGYALEQTGGGRLLAVEHDPDHAETTRRRLHTHGLDTFAEVALCPLVHVSIEGKTFLWYDLEGVSLPESIDLLLVDGPPESIGDQARYPALPLLFESLSAQAVVILDDADRPDEQAIISGWCDRFDLTAEMIDTTKGVAILSCRPRHSQA